ncbi:MAG: hypothetical protein ACTHU0_27630 [Kofleriaceae bacterium]
MPATVLAAMCALVAPAVAQPKSKADKGDKGDKAAAQPEKADKGAKKPDGKAKNFDFTALDLNGRMRTPQLLYFLERANEELERASLEKRSFIPHIVRTVEEEPL